ncbi:hypothetical protein [Sphaerisporangium sp. TRM90804]|uniref:hypothetical protein n=1 Tax=Sphaerisporangium sp. TRM90804 TaxID=3031113 RepID=UPI002448414C|nr:hypothetical protein [Sphaerisporangium sp. TRM90804]MDH2424839.1 hypothetical protein [Sphaerisporangium sp. TRM90804]
MGADYNEGRVFEEFPPAEQDPAVDYSEMPPALPLDLAVIKADRQTALAWLHANGPKDCPAVMETVARVYDLIAELEDLREQLDAFEDLPTREEYIETFGSHPDEAPLVLPCSPFRVQEVVNAGRMVWVRTLAEHPWRRFTGKR